MIKGPGKVDRSRTKVELESNKNTEQKTSEELTGERALPRPLWTFAKRLRVSGLQRPTNIFARKNFLRC